MIRNASVGYAVFAATLIATGAVGLAWGGFATAVPGYLPAHEAVGYLCAFVNLACGLGLLWPRSVAIAARVLLVYLVLWMVLLDGPIIVAAPLVEGSWQNWGETAVVVAGAWVLYARFATEGDRRRLGFATGDSGLRIARVLFAFAMFAFGLSHFFYLGLTAPLIPGWLPWHAGWAYFFGATYLAAGFAVLIGVSARLATALATVQMGLFTVLVWIPILATGHTSAQNWSEFADSWTMTAAAWVVADSYRGKAWFAVGHRGRTVTPAGRGAVSAK